MDKLWWSIIPNARKFVDDITYVLKDERSAIYSVNGTLPWSETFSSVLSSAIENAEKDVDIIYAEDLGGKSPGEYLFNTYCKRELRIKYRTTRGYENFLAANDTSTILINKFVYVKKCDFQAAKQWIDFICKYNNYHNKNSLRCCFLIENCSEYAPNCNIEHFQWTSYYHQYDINMFCMLNASLINENDLIKSYLAELTCALSQNDVELASELVRAGVELINNPEKTLKYVIENTIRSDYSSYSMPSNVSTCIKSAQVKVFYPVIERYRTWFINEYIDQFTDDFRHITAFGDIITDCHDLELGDLVYLCKKSKLNVDYKDYKCLKSFHNYRNNLAHRSLLTVDIIQSISDFSNGEIYNWKKLAEIN